MPLVNTLQVMAANAQVECLQGASCDTGLPMVQASNGNLTTLMGIVFGIIGAVAIIVIIIGAMNMSLAEGDAQKVARARQTVIFALVGLVIAISAEAIIAFVIKNL
jgi:hypothetical protein